jgi:DNA-binding NarL/FixJ family response regulator
VTRVLIVDDHAVFRDGLTGLLATLPDVEIAGTAWTAEEALAGLRDSAPDIVLMDINPPGASGVEATRGVLAAAPATAVPVISMVDDDDSVFAALAAGARGYVLKGASAGEITAALRTVAAGGAVFGAGIASRFLARRPPTCPAGAPIPARRPDRAGTRGGRPARRRCPRAGIHRLGTPRACRVPGRLQRADPGGVRARSPPVRRLVPRAPTAPVWRPAG